jgi:hypothetical protein
MLTDYTNVNRRNSSRENSPAALGHRFLAARMNVASPSPTCISRPPRRPMSTLSMACRKALHARTSRLARQRKPMSPTISAVVLPQLAFSCPTTVRLMDVACKSTALTLTARPQTLLQLLRVTKPASVQLRRRLLSIRLPLHLGLLGRLRRRRQLLRAGQPKPVLAQFQ